jgi:hypothetical protein
MKALIIRSKWLDLILSGKKIWELRTRQTRIRGRIALIRAGSGVVEATAELVECLPALDRDQFSRTRAFHGVSPDLDDAVLESGWTTPWVLGGVRKLVRPIPYQHPSGAVIWVEVPEVVEESGDPQGGSAAVNGSDTDTKTRSTPLTTRAPVRQSEVRGQGGDGRSAVTIALTQGNINNAHFYLRSATSLLPQDCIGGSNRTQIGKTVTVRFSPGATTQSDVDGAKMIFRCRAAVRDFFEKSNCVAGDSIQIERLGEREFRVSKV